MSSLVSAWVWSHAPVKSGELVVLLAIADNAHDDGGGAYPSQAHLAEKARLTPRQVRNCLTGLQNKGLIESCGQTRAGTTVWRVVMIPPQPVGPEGGENSSSWQSTASSPGNLFPTEPSENRHGGEVRLRLKYNGSAVKQEPWEKTVRALAEYNRQTGSSLSPVTGTGEASENAKRIYGRLRHWPDLTDSQIADAIRRTLASRWWGEDEPSVGVVFGPKVFEENLVRSGKPRNGNGHGNSEDYAAAERYIAGLRANGR